MRCPDPDQHEPHWHTIIADNIVVAGGQCFGTLDLARHHAPCLEQPTPEESP